VAIFTVPSSYGEPTRGGGPLHPSSGTVEPPPPQPGEVVHDGSPLFGKALARLPDYVRQGVKASVDVMLRASFGGEPRSKWVETGVAIDLSTGKPAGVPLITGQVDGLDFTPVHREIRSVADLMLMHTHPSSSAPSFDDFYMLYRLTEERGTLPQPLFGVVGQDGSWYTLSVGRINSAEASRLRRVHSGLHGSAVAEASRQTSEDAIKALGGKVVRHTTLSGGLPAVVATGLSHKTTGEAVLTQYDVVLKAGLGRVDVNSLMDKNYKPLSVGVWEKLAAEFPVKLTTGDQL